MDTQRFASRFVQANIWGGYSIGQVITDATGDYFFIGGTLSGRDNIWQADLLRINIQTAGTDVFEIIFRTTADASTGSAPASGGGSIGGGLTQGVADNRYLRQSQNLSDIPNKPTARANLGLGIFATLNELPRLTSGDGVNFITGSSEVFDTSTQVFDTSEEVFFNEDAFYDGTQPAVFKADTDNVTIGAGSGELEVLDAGITAPKLATDSVTTAKIQNGAVTNAKLENSTISGKALGTNLDALSAGDGLTGSDYNGGVLRTFALGNPSTTTVGGSNGVTSDSHTHALDLSGRTLTAGNGLTGGGDLGSDRTFDVDPNEPIYINSGKVDIRDATDSIRGVVTTSAQTFAGEKTFEDAIILDPQTTDPSVGAGKVWFDEDLQTISFYDENDNIIRVNQQVTVRVKNTSGASIAKGVPVRVCTSGFAGDLVCVRPAQGDTATNSNVIGVTAEAIANNAVGTAIEFGKLEKVNTNSFNIGDTLFLSPTVAGGLTTTKPTYSDFAIRIGIVTRKSSTVGAILILIEQNFDIFTSGRVMFANGDGRIAEDSEFNFDASESELQVPNIAFDGKIESDKFAVVADLIAGMKYDEADETLRVATLRANALVVKSFTAEVAQIFRGELAISKSFGILARDFVVPALNQPGTLVIHDVEGFGGFNVFENADIVEIKLFFYVNGGELIIGSVFGEVSNAQPNTPEDGLQSYTFTTRFVQANELIGKTAQTGAEARSFGSIASPTGVIFDSVFEGTPSRTMYTWTTNPWDANNRTILNRIGNLDSLGISGVTGDGAYFRDQIYIDLRDVSGQSVMALGKNVDGAGNVGIHINDDNYWYGANRFALGGAQGVTFAESEVFDLSEEVFDTSNAVFDYGGVTVGSDTKITGTLSLVDSNGKTMLIGPNANGLGNAGLFIDNDNYWFPSLGFKSTVVDGISSQVSSLEIRTNEIELFTREGGQIGVVGTEIPSGTPITSISINVSVTIEIVAQTTLIIGEENFVVDTTIQLTSGETNKAISVESKTISTAIPVTTEVLAPLNIAFISQRVSDVESTVVLKAQTTDAQGRVSIASVSIESDPTGSAIKLKADDIFFDATETLTARAGEIAGDISGLELRADEAELFTRSATIVGDLIDQITGTVNLVTIASSVSVVVPANTTIIVGGIQFVTTSQRTLVAGENNDFPVTPKTISTTISAGAISAALNLASISTRVTDQGAQTVLKAQTNGTLSLVALTASPEGESAVLIKSDKFDLESAVFAVKSTGSGLLALGSSASSQTLYSGIGVFADGNGSFRVGETSGTDLVNGIAFDSATDKLSIITDDFKLETPQFDIDSSRDKKLIISNDDSKEVINIGDFDFGSFVDDELSVSTTNGATTSSFTDATVSYSATQIIGNGGQMTQDRSVDQNILDGAKTLQSIRGKWVRIQFDWLASGYDITIDRFAVGYEISYPLGAISELNRDPNDTADSGSVDTGFVFMPENVAEEISVGLRAPDGGLFSGDLHGSVSITNLVITEKEETTYVDIGNDGVRAYSAGGLNLLDFTPGNAKATFKELSIGNWKFQELPNGNLGLYFKETLRQTFTK
jgi:hypothetical protein